MARKLSRQRLATHIANELIKGTPSKILAQQLAAYLIDTRRTKEAAVIVRDISYILAEQGHIYGTITASRTLSAETQNIIQAFTKQKTGAKQVTLTTTTDQSVLGGVKLQTPGFELDATVKRQLTLLKTRFKKA